jgi:2-keto-4-pentenoate hydratase/2-oxohepta-3-ene-1,7-dioic acid hydratase in catechol pathway
MKLATYLPRAAQSPNPGIGAVLDGMLIDLNYAYARYLRSVDGELRAYALADARIPRDMIGFLQGGQRAIDAARRTIQFVGESPAGATGISGERLRYDLHEVRLLAPISRPGKILGAGKNYLDHAQEGAAAGQAVEIQPFPRGFVKVSSAVIGPDDPVVLPHVTMQLDYEVELAVVIGKPGRYISKARAYDYVAGYTILNDVSARDIQAAESKYGNHMIAKNMDTLSPMGPWIVLKDEVEDPMHLDVRLSINGELRQHASTSSLIHDIATMIERWSWGTLEPGDVIATGTPAGVALGGKYPYLRAGDLMECAVEKVGELRNRVIAEAEAGV